MHMLPSILINIITCPLCSVETYTKKHMSTPSTSCHEQTIDNETSQWDSESNYTVDTCSWSMPATRKNCAMIYLFAVNRFCFHFLPFLPLYAALFFCPILRHNLSCCSLLHRYCCSPFQLWQTNHCWLINMRSPAWTGQTPEINYSILRYTEWRTCCL